MLQIDLVDLLQLYSVRPARVVGHSSGEIAAAHCVGALHKLNAVFVAYLGSVASARLKMVAPELDGGMMVVGSSQQDIEDLISRMGDTDLTVACVNCFVHVTISGLTRHPGSRRR